MCYLIYWTAEATTISKTVISLHIIQIQLFFVFNIDIIVKARQENFIPKALTRYTDKRSRH